ncbi:MAG: hypothetical protein GX023_10110 [Tissierellia bacterium]|nr:hypothetical protein [Tissierellia bacterium]
MKVYISEKEIFLLMKRKCQGKMGIFITHRVENIKDLDPRIIVFSDGKIVGDGNTTN